MAAGEPVEAVCARVLARVEAKLYSIRFVVESMRPRVPRGLLNALCLGVLRNYRLLTRALRLCGFKGQVRGSAAGWLPLVLAYEAMFRDVSVERIEKLGLPRTVAACLRGMSPEDVVRGLTGVRRLAILYSLPEWVAEELAKVEPPGGLEALLESFQRPTPMWIRFNKSKLGPREAVEALERLGIKVRLDPILDDSLEVLEVSPGAMEKLDTTLFYVQDRSAMLVAHLLPNNVENLADLFSAPGNKAAHAWWRGVYTYAVGLEVSPRRLRDERRLVRLQGAWGLDVVGGDALNPPLREGVFDAAIVDPDCTSMGRLGHSPETRLFLERSGRRIVERLSQLQLAGLRSALRLVKKGGIVVYSTCTLTIEENEGVIGRVLEDGSAELVEARPLIGVWSPVLAKAQRIYPHISRCMGGFAAVLVRE